MHSMKLMLILVNFVKVYQNDYEKNITSYYNTSEWNEKSAMGFRKSWLLLLIRSLHFKINTLILPNENKMVDINTNLGTVISFPVMSSSVLSHVYQGSPEFDTSQILSEQLNLGDVVLDLGAYYGYFTILMSQLVGDKGKVFSFEPTKESFQLLKKNIAEFKNIRCYNLGLYSIEKAMYFNNFGTNYNSFNSLYSARLNEELKSRKVLTNFIKLDNFITKENINPSFIKIDCESSEIEILKGTESFIRYQRPMLLIEFGDTINKNHLQQTKSVHNYLLNRSYVCYRRYREGYKKIGLENFYPYFNPLFIPNEKKENFECNNKIII